MGYVIKHKSGKYVARSGSEQSYTKRLENAKHFSTKEKALGDMCPGGDECVLNIDQIMEG